MKVSGIKQDILAVGVGGKGLKSESVHATMYLLQGLDNIGNWMQFEWTVMGSRVQKFPPPPHWPVVVAVVIIGVTQH